MGGGSSDATVTQVVNNKVINRNQVEALNETLNKHVSNVLVENSKVCGANASSSQNSSFVGNVVYGDFNYDLNQGTNVNLNFSCSQQSDQVNEMATDIFNQMMNSIDISNSSEMIADLNAAAKATMEAGFGSTGPPATSNVDSSVYNEVENYNDFYIRNVVENIVEHNFGVEDVQSCIPVVGSDQNSTVNNNIIHGNANLTINQETALTLFAECDQLSSTTNKMSADIANALGVEIDNTNSVITESNLRGETESENKQTGIFQDLGEMFGDLFAGIGNMINGIFGGIFGSAYTASVACSIICCLCCVCVIVLCIVAMSGGLSGSSSTETGSNSYGQSTGYSQNTGFGQTL